MGTIHMVMLSGQMAKAMQAPKNSCFALIANMAVHPKARGKGIGRALLRSCEQRAETFRPRPQALLMLVGSFYPLANLDSHLPSPFLPAGQLEDPFTSPRCLPQVYRSNRHAVSLYRSEGFEECAEWVDPSWLEDAERGRLGEERRLLFYKEFKQANKSVNQS